MAEIKREPLVIQGMTFYAVPKYKAGHTLLENEASTLNQTLFENLRNNFANKADAGKEAGITIEVLQQQFEDYESEYEFGARRGGGPRGDPVRTLAMNIAREQVRQAIKKRGFDMEEFPAQRITALAAQLIDQQGADGKLMTLARQQLESEQKAAADELDGLLNEAAPEAAE